MALFKKFSAVILAGGQSTRMGNSKQLLVLEGIPVVVRSMLAFENAPSCSEILVVAKEDELPLYEDFKEKYHLTKFKKAVVGGNTRQESAFNGMMEVDKKSDYIAIHDAARCLITPKNIEFVFNTAKRTRAASAATKATDTVKIVGKYKKTLTEHQPERETLYYMQTPQIFYADLYRAAAYTAKKDGFKATDDASLLEHVGFGVTLVDVQRNNMKLTTKEDVEIFKALLKNETEDQK